MEYFEWLTRTTSLELEPIPKPSRRPDEPVASSTAVQGKCIYQLWPPFHHPNLGYTGVIVTYSLDKLENTSLGDEQESGSEDGLHELGLDTLVQAWQGINNL